MNELIGVVSVLSGLLEALVGAQDKHGERAAYTSRHQLVGNRLLITMCEVLQRQSGQKSRERNCHAVATPFAVVAMCGACDISGAGQSKNRPNV